MSGSNNKVGGKAVTTRVQDNPSIISAKQHLALEEALQYAKDEIAQQAIQSESQIRDILMSKYRAEKHVPRKEQELMDGKKKRKLDYEAAEKEIDGKQNRQWVKGTAGQAKQKERKDKYDKQEKLEDWSARLQRDTAGRNVKHYAQALIDYEEGSAERQKELLDVRSSAQYDVDEYRDEVIKQWAEDRKQRIAWGRYRKEKKGPGVVDVEENQDSVLEDVDCTEKSAKNKSSKEHENKVQYSDKGDQANGLTLDDEVDDVDEWDNEHPPPKRRAVGK